MSGCYRCHQGKTLPTDLSHLSVNCTRKGTNSTAWVTPRPTFDTLVFIGGIAIWSEPQQVRQSWIIYPVALWQRAPVWSWMVLLKISPPPSCRAPWSTLHTGGYVSTPRPADRCGLGLVVRCHHVCKIFSGWIPNGRREPFSTPPFVWLVLWPVVVACLVLACVSIADWGWLGQWRCRACHRCRGATRRSWKFSFCGFFHKAERVVKMTRSEYVDHDILTGRFHVTHYAGCAILFNKDTFYPNIDVKSIYLHDTRRDLPDQVMEGEQGWVLQGVLSRAIFRRPPLSGQETFTVLSLHISHIYAKQRGIAKKLILTIRAIMISQQIDVVAGDFNGAAWRCSNRNRNISSTLDEAFADCAFPTPPGLTALWGPGSIPNNRADICGFLKPPGSDRYWKVRMHGAFSIPRKALGLRPNDQSGHHETWLHLEFVD